KELADRIAAIPPGLVDNVESDDAEVRAFLKSHRHLFVPLEDLERAREALHTRIDKAKLKSNPLYIDLDEDPAADKHIKHELDELRAKRRKAEAQLDKPNNVSADGLIGELQVRTAFRATDAARGQALIASLDKLRDDVVDRHPGTRVGFTGGIVTA